MDGLGEQAVKRAEERRKATAEAFENPLNWTTRRFIFAKQREYEHGPPSPEPSGELSCEAATEENAKRRSLLLLMTVASVPPINDQSSAATVR
jgi:hypothetical protein